MDLKFRSTEIFFGFQFGAANLVIIVPQYELMNFNVVEITLLDLR